MKKGFLFLVLSFSFSPPGSAIEPPPTPYEVCIKKVGEELDKKARDRTEPMRTFRPGQPIPNLAVIMSGAKDDLEQDNVARKQCEKYLNTPDTPDQSKQGQFGGPLGQDTLKWMKKQKQTGWSKQKKADWQKKIDELEQDLAQPGKKGQASEPPGQGQTPSAGQPGAGSQEAPPPREVKQGPPPPSPEEPKKEEAPPPKEAKKKETSPPEEPKKKEASPPEEPKKEEAPPPKEAKKGEAPPPEEAKKEEAPSPKEAKKGEAPPPEEAKEEEAPPCEVQGEGPPPRVVPIEEPPSPGREGLGFPAVRVGMLRGRLPPPCKEVKGEGPPPAEVEPEKRRIHLGRRGEPPSPKERLEQKIWTVKKKLENLKPPQEPDSDASEMDKQLYQTRFSDYKSTKLQLQLDLEELEDQLESLK